MTVVIKSMEYLHWLYGNFLSIYVRTANVVVCTWAVLELCFSVVQYAACAHAQGMFSLTTYFVFNISLLHILSG